VLVAAEHSRLGIVVARQKHISRIALQESNGAGLLHHWGAATETSAAISHFFNLG